MKKQLTTPRIIGILLLIIATFLYFQRLGYISIALAGAILLVSPAKSTQQLFDEFIKTFTRGKIIIMTALFDALFWLLAFGSAYFYQWRLASKAATSDLGSMMGNRNLIDQAFATQSMTTLKSLATFLIAGLVILLIFNLITYTLSRGMIWTTIANKKPNKKFFKRFLTLNALWWAIWVPLIVLLAMATAQARAIQSGIVSLLVIAAYFTPILHTQFMTGRKIKQSIGGAFAIGITKIFKLVVPYTFAFILYVILYQLFRFVQNQPKTIMFTVSMLFVVLYMSWLRVYLYSVIKKLI